MAKSEALPTFKYHPDPLKSGSVVNSKDTCHRCKTARGYIYEGPTYGDFSARDDIDDDGPTLCPWCIADGSAHEEFHVTFQDEAAIPGPSFEGAPAVSEAVIAEVSQRTPGFTGWQDSEWFTCCDDAAAFVGKFGGFDLQAKMPEALQSLRQTSGLEDDDDWEVLVDSLDAEESPTAYVFQCLKCGKYGCYSDSD